MTANFVPFVPQQPVQAAPVAQQFAQPVQQVPQQFPMPMPSQGQGGFGQQRPKGPNIWYRPVTQADYKKLAEMGTATIVIRILPGYNQAGLYEAVFEKNTANSKFPNSKRWLCPVMVLSDSLNPERNGFVGVMEVSKTLYNRIKNKNTPPNYFDFNAGHNFHINVSLAQSKDGNQWFPQYNKSGFEAQPSPCQAQYAASKMNEGKFSDFATFMSRINNPKQQGQVPYNPAQQQAPQAFAQQQTPQYNPQPVAQQQFIPQAAPQQQFIPQAAPQQFAPQGQQQQFAPQNYPPVGSPPAAPMAQGPAGSEAEFDEIFNNG